MKGSGEKGEHSLIEKLMDTKETQQGELRLKIVGVMYFVYSPLDVNSLTLHIVLYIYTKYNAYTVLFIQFKMHILQEL